MTFVFVSHAGPDKIRHVRPLAQALAIEGVALWLDRPGPGPGSFGFDEAFVRRHAVRGLRPGRPWDRQISEALRDAGAVLGCLSPAMLADRAVLHQELAIAWHLGKLVTCTIEGIDHAALPPNLGLPDFGRIQSVPVETAALQAALDWLESNPGAATGELPATHGRAWAPVAQLRDALLQRAPGAAPGHEEAVIARLLAMPIGPAVLATDIPLAVIQAMSDRHADPVTARSHFDLAMQRAGRVHPARFTSEQTVVRPGEVPSPFHLGLDEYWAAALGAAGLKSRRTLGALLEPAQPAAKEPRDQVIATYLRRLSEGDDAT